MDEFDKFVKRIHWLAIAVAILSLAAIGFIVWVIIQLLDILRQAA